MTVKVIQGHLKWHEWVSLLVVCRNNVSMLHRFFTTATFTMYVTACRAPNLEKSFILENSCDERR